MQEAIFFFWILLLAPDRLGGPGEFHYYPDKVTCEKARAINAHANSGIPGYRIAPACIALRPIEDKEGRI
ncbi:MAG: hypothetical protein ACE5GT_11000 [Rhodospirillales bacterium]